MDSTLFSPNWEKIVRFLNETDHDFAYWSIDGYKRPGQGEGYGLLEEDYSTIRCEQSLLAPASSPDHATSAHPAVQAPLEAGTAAGTSAHTLRSRACVEETFVNTTFFFAAVPLKT